MGVSEWPSLFQRVSGRLRTVNIPMPFSEQCNVRDNGRKITGETRTISLILLSDCCLDYSV